MRSSETTNCHVREVSESEMSEFNEVRDAIEASEAID